MRRIASNYVFLPGTALISGVYAEYDDVYGRFRIAAFESGCCEIEGLEFYSGILTDARLADFIDELKRASDLRETIGRIYKGFPVPAEKLAVLSGCVNFRWGKHAKFRILV